MTSATTSTFRLREIPRSIWALGFVSMFMDISSQMIHALLPVYLVTVLGASNLTVGFIEGIAEATAMITKIFSGALSDWLGRRKALTAFGYGLAAFTKPIFPLATSVGWLVAARFVDRLGKGIRGAPRDALIVRSSSKSMLGFLRKSPSSMSHRWQRFCCILSLPLLLSKSPHRARGSVTRRRSPSINGGADGPAPANPSRREQTVGLFVRGHRQRAQGRRKSLPAPTCQ
jgi:hypothetical protein